MNTYMPLAYIQGVLVNHPMKGSVELNVRLGTPGVTHVVLIPTEVYITSDVRP